MALSNYRPRRRTGPNPDQKRRRPRWRSGTRGPRFVIQHHREREDHYDFRLEINGVLVSWAIPRGPGLSAQGRRMARRVEDCPLQDATIGDDAGEDVYVWDSGTYVNRTAHEMTTCLGSGHLSFSLNGEKLHGGYALTRVRDGATETWLLFERRDGFGSEAIRQDAGR